MDSELEFREKECVRCKKAIIPGPEWVYKTGSSHNYQYFCSWKCMRAWEGEWKQKRGSKIDRRDRIVELINEGKTAAEIVDELHVDRSNVIYWQRKLGVLHDK